MPRKHLPSGPCASARSSKGLETTPSPPERPQRGRDPPERARRRPLSPRAGSPPPQDKDTRDPDPPEPPGGTTTAGSGPQPPPPPPARGRSFTSGARSSARSQGGRHGARWARPSASPHQASWGGPPGQAGPGDARRGKNTGVGCHFLLQCMKVKSESERAQSYLTLCDPMVCSLPGSSVHGIFQARVLEWVAMPSSKGSSRRGD